MKNYKRLGLVSAHTGQIVVTNPVNISQNWTDSSSKGVSFWGEGAPVIASILIEHTPLQIDKINNWYRIKEGATVKQLEDIALSIQVALHVETLQGDAMFDRLRELNETPLAGGSIVDGIAVTSYFEVGMYPVYISEGEEEVLIGEKQNYERFPKENLGTLITTGPLLICDPANIRLHDFVSEGENNILPHINELISSSNGGQLTFTALQIQEFFIACKVSGGAYCVEGYYEIDEEGLRVYRTMVLRPLTSV